MHLIQDNRRDAGLECPCSDYVRVRPEESDLIRRELERLPRPRILDIGCGVGRHVSFVRALSDTASITVVEPDDELRNHIAGNDPAVVVHEWLRDIPVDARFDVVLLLGNNMGVFSTEQDARDGIRRIHEMLSAGGVAIIESGGGAPVGFHTGRHQIAYGRLIDEPFAWGYASHPWLERELAASGFILASVTPSGLHPEHFRIYVARRP